MIFGFKKKTNEPEAESSEKKGATGTEASTNLSDKKYDDKKNIADGSGDNTEAARQALQKNLVAASFGNIVSVFMRSTSYKQYSLADLEWLVVPAIMTNQFSLAETSAQEKGPAAPVGVALWAKVSDEVDKKLSENLDMPARLRPDEWKSGEICWIVDAAGQSKAIKAMITRLRAQVFAGKPVKMRGRDEGGKRTVITFKPVSANNAKASAN